MDLFYTSRQDMHEVNRCWCVDNCLCTRYICTYSGTLGQRPWFWQGNWLPLGWNACAPTCLQNSVGSSRWFFFWFAITWMLCLLKEEFMSPSIEILALGLVMCRQRTKLKKLGWRQLGLTVDKWDYLLSMPIHSRSEAHSNSLLRPLPPRSFFRRGMRS